MGLEKINDPFNARRLQTTNLDASGSVESVETKLAMASLSASPSVSVSSSENFNESSGESLSKISLNGPIVDGNDLYRIMRRFSPCITSSQAGRLSAFATEHSHAYLQAAIEEGSEMDTIVHPTNELARSLVFTRTGHIFVLLNRKKAEDTSLGTGSSKVVTTAVDLISGKVVASAGLKFVDDEVQMLEMVRGDDHFVQLIDHAVYPNEEAGFDEEPEKHRLFLEFCEGGDLARAFSNKKITSTENQKIIFEGLIEGVATLHDLGYIHRDLKPANILLRIVDDMLVPVIADLGTACKSNEPSGKTFYSTTEGYTSPELAKAFRKNGRMNPHIAEATTEKLDAWSLGCILYETLGLNKEHPLPWFESEQGFIDGLIQLPENWWPFEAAGEDSPITVVKGLLEVDPENRITVKEARERLANLHWDIPTAISG